METQLVKINVNGADYNVKAGMSVLEACRSVGVEIPFFCYHPNLKVAGSCRMCLVTIGLPARDRATGALLKKSDGSPEIAFMPKPAIACGTTVAENMHIVTDSEAVKNCRKSVLEFLLLNTLSTAPSATRRANANSKNTPTGTARESRGTLKARM